MRRYLLFATSSIHCRTTAAGFAALLILALASTCNAKSYTITINKPRTNATYMLDLMKLALSYSDNTYTINTTAERLAKGASAEAAINGDISVLWGGTSEQKEMDYQPVRIDAYRGLMSLRFMIIREGEQHIFDQIQTPSDLKSIRFGQGRTWQDARILEHSGYTVEKATKKNSLYYMLEGGRFDAFPRGATEAWKEAASFNHLSLTVEKGLIISYPLPTYFFVHKGYDYLAKDLENGLEQALADGKFAQYFYDHERVIAFLNNADLDNRRVIKLTNPFLPAATPLQRKELWPSIETLIEGAKRHAMAKTAKTSGDLIGQN